MGRPESIAGLLVELVRRRGVPRWTRALVAAGAAVTAGVALSRTHEARPAPRPSTELTRWMTAPLDGSVLFVDPAAVATDLGWVVAWTRWERGSEPVVQVAALDRSGSLRGVTRSVSPPGSFARGPSLARSGARVAVAWTSSNSVRSSIRPWLAVVDADAQVLVPARPVSAGPEQTFDAEVASDGQGWGVAWRSWSASHPGLTLALLTPDGAPRGPITRLPVDHVGVGVGLAWMGDAWFAPVASYDYERDRSALQLHWFDRGGRLIESRSMAPSRGEIGPLQATARGATAWISWGDDAGFGVRHDPRAASFEGRRTAAGPVALGPRRSGSIPTLACTATGCTSAWIGLPEDGDEAAALHVHVFDTSGAPRGAARRIGPRASFDRRRGVALAGSPDERESLALWGVRQGDASRLMTVRLDTDGAPRTPPAMLPLP